MDLSYLDLLVPESDQLVEAEGGGGVWVVAELDDGALATVTLQAMSAARNLADSLGAYIYAVLVGHGITDQAQTLYQAGADGVRVADHPGLLDFALEPYMGVLGELLQAERPEIVLMGATKLGAELAPRLAQRLGGGLIEHVTSVALDEATRSVRAGFPVYGGEYFDIAACPAGQPQFLTLQPGAFAMPFMDTGRHGEPTILEVTPPEAALRVSGPVQDFAPGAVSLAEARTIVAAGRQCGDFGLVTRLASALGAQLAGDRGARDAGWIGAHQIVDLRGTQVKPELYLAVGVRGDTFHNAAIEAAKFIIAIHPEPGVPIFDVADICAQADPLEVLTALLDQITGA